MQQSQALALEVRAFPILLFWDQQNRPFPTLLLPLPASDHHGKNDYLPDALDRDANPRFAFLLIPGCSTIYRMYHPQGRRPMQRSDARECRISHPVIYAFLSLFLPYSSSNILAVALTCSGVAFSDAAAR